MKKLIVVLFAVTLLSGCAAWAAKVHTFWDSELAKIEAVDWAAKCTWYDKATDGLNAALEVAQPYAGKFGVTIEIAQIAIMGSRVAADGLCALIADWKAGTVTIVDVKTQAAVVASAYDSAKTKVGAIVLTNP